MIKEDLKIVLIAVITALLITSIYKCNNRDRTKDIVRSDTITVVRIDTINVTRPVYISSKVVDTVKVVDTLISRDTLYIPITQRVYKDSNYTAYVSGYMPSLDSITLFNRTVYRDITTIITPPKPRPKRFGLGVQVGYGFGTNGLQPYIGIGVSYNVIRF